jgi:tetraacyldisaccharide 4'-kinase
MQPPRFWYEAEGRDAAPILQALLQPLAWAYAGAGAWKQYSARPTRVGAPVVCVGNLTVGGAGKTPVTRALRQLINGRGVDAHTMSRGYGGRLKGPHRVDAARDVSRDVGDEPLLHGADGPAWIARDRVAGAHAAIDAGAKLILLDDGFQNPALHKDFNLIVIDCAAGFGNRRVFPAGPLREPMRAGLARAQGVVLMGEGDIDATFACPVFRAALHPAQSPPPGRLLAFAGIARPTKFFDTLKAYGADLVDAAAFPDHHPYSEDDFKQLTDYAQRMDARLITTEKDYVRLSPQQRQIVLTLPVEARFENSAALMDALDPVLQRATGKV